VLFENDKDLVGAPTPVLASPGLSFGWYPIGRSVGKGSFGFGMKIRLDFYMTNFGWPVGASNPVPVEIENRSTYVIGLPLSLLAEASWQPFSRFAFRLNAGIAADLRIALLALDLNSSDKNDSDPNSATYQNKKTAPWFWQNFRWFYIEAGLGADYIITNKWRVALDARALVPVTDTSHKGRLGADISAVRTF
jgi:hypothetical protein